MNLKPEEISSVIKEQIKQYSTKFEVADTGTVIQVDKRTVGYRRRKLSMEKGTHAMLALLETAK